MFWGNSEMEWTILHSVCENLTDYHLLRSKFNIRTSEIKYVFQRFVTPDITSHHANRVNFVYELHHRARGLKFHRSARPYIRLARPLLEVMDFRRPCRNIEGGLLKNRG